MKHTLLVIGIILFSVSLQAQKVDFDKYFTNKTLRFDYIDAGNSDTAYIFLQQIKQEPYWGGPHHNLIDTFNYGKLRFQAFDKKSGKLIYSTTYNTLFLEWQASPEAKQTSRSFYESVVMPYPKNDITIKIQRRNKKNQYYTVFTYNFSPGSIFVKKDLVYNFETKDILNNGDPAQKVDIAILAEGYTKKEMKDFQEDAKRLVDTLFAYEPFKSHKQDFNVHLILSYSNESGTDIPGDSIWKQTIVNSSFWTFNIERYLTTTDFKSVRDVAALVPYDQIYILVNTKKYGGGGIYNFFNLCCSDHIASPQVFVHEFGHGFGGLADEYGYGDDANEDMYDLSVEPPEPNITTLVDFDKKWKNMVTPGTPIPTPAIPKYKDAVGAFEGAGYLSKGIYRPQQNCMMRALAYPFCKVCNKALTQMIEFYTDK